MAMLTTGYASSVSLRRLISDAIREFGCRASCLSETASFCVLKGSTWPSAA
jgi:hypothetical protein